MWCILKCLYIHETDTGWKATIEFHEKKREGKQMIPIVLEVDYPKTGKEIKFENDNTMIGTARNIGNICVSGFSRTMPKTLAIKEEHSKSFGSVYGVPDSIVRQEILLDQSGKPLRMVIDGVYDKKADPALVKTLKTLEDQEFKDLLELEQIKKLREQIKESRGKKKPLETYYPKQYVYTEEGWMPQFWLEHLNKAKKETQESKEDFKLNFLVAMAFAETLEEKSEVIKQYSVSLSDKKETEEEIKVVPCKSAEGRILSYDPRTFTNKKFSPADNHQVYPLSWKERINSLFRSNKLNNFQIKIALASGFLENLSLIPKSRFSL